MAPPPPPPHSALASQIFHPNVVLFMGASTDPNDKLMIVTERLPTDLYTLLIENKNKYDLSLRKRMKVCGARLSLFVWWPLTLGG